MVGTRAQGQLSSQDFTPQDLAQVPGMAPHPDDPFVIRSQPGPEHDSEINGDRGPDRQRPALTITDLIQAAGVPLGDVKYAEAIGANGSSHPLAAQQVQSASGNGFANGLSPSVWVDDDPISPTMNYFRPLQAGPASDGSDANDVNAGDWLSLPRGKPLVIVLHKTGGLLQNIQITGPTDVRGATPVQYGVTVPDAPAGLEYQWSVGPVSITPQPVASPTLKHTFPDVTEPTLVALTVDVTAADNSSGTATVLVTVCSKDGHTKDCDVDTGNPNPGGGDTPPTQPPHPHDSTGSTPTTGPSGSQDPQSPSTSTGDPSQEDGSQQTPGTGRTPTTKGEPGSKSGHQHAGPQAGQKVSGQLLAASAALVVPEQSPTVTAAAADSQPSKPHWTWPWRFAGLLVLPLLIGIGMAGESLPLRRRLARMKA